MKKYKLTEETKIAYGRTLHRIEALRDFGDVKAGEKGGWIESEYNLSHDGTCWVGYGSRVLEMAKVLDDAKVYRFALVYGEAEISDNAQVYEFSKVHGFSRVFNNAKVNGASEICDCAYVCEDSEISDFSSICGTALICGKAKIRMTMIDYGLHK